MGCVSRLLRLSPTANPASAFATVGQYQARHSSEPAAQKDLCGKTLNLALGNPDKAPFCPCIWNHVALYRLSTLSLYRPIAGAIHP